MDHFRSNALVKDFPFLAAVLHGDTRDCEKITVTKATKDMLLSIPEHFRQDGSSVGINEKTSIHFVLTDGTIIENAVIRQQEFRSHAAHSQTHRQEGESIIAAIGRLNVADTLAYMVRVFEGYEVIEHFSTDQWRAEVVKPAKGFTWESVVQEQQDRADAVLAAEIVAAFGE